MSDLVRGPTRRLHGSKSGGEHVGPSMVRFGRESGLDWTPGPADPHAYLASPRRRPVKREVVFVAIDRGKERG